MKILIIGLILFGFTFGIPLFAESELTATIIGSGSPIFNEKRCGPSVLISAGDTKLLVDMGNGTQANLYKLGIKIPKLSYLLFTHHHRDHNEEFLPILIKLLLARHNFTIIGPPNTKKLTKAYFELYAQDIAYRLGKSGRNLADRKKNIVIKDIKGGENFAIQDIKVSTTQVPHTIHTIAYRFDYKGKSIVISGDLTYSDNLTKLAHNANFLIIDSGGMVMTGGRRRKKRGKFESGKKGRKQKTNKKRTKAHLNLEESSLIAKQANVKNLAYTHFTSGEVDKDASLKIIRKNFKGNVIFGNDLMVLKISDSSQKLYSYPIVDTGQKQFYSNNKTISSPNRGKEFFGQDANYIINSPSYEDNKNGTITDNITGLMWQKNMNQKISYDNALKKVKHLQTGGYNDWRVPTIKELYSLILFTGQVRGQKAITPFIDTKYFNQPIGNSSKGEREIDAQTWSITEYVGKTMKNDDTVFGVNFVDGRIKGYPKYNPRTGNPNKMYFRFVRGNPDYGKNIFINNKNGIISDSATGLMWQKSDSKQGMPWADALMYAENLKLGGYSDWRLPNAKELQSILDYTRSPSTSNSPAIDPIFQSTSILNEAEKKDYPYYWTSTTHLDGPVPEKNAAYLAFGRALGKMHGTLMDVHGAGSQRSDPKTGNSFSRGPQGDIIRVKNHVRCVRGGKVYVNKFMMREDKNMDGRVSKSEFKGPTKHFKMFDVNNDGYITENEAPNGRPIKRKNSTNNNDKN